MPGRKPKFRDRIHLAMHAYGITVRGWADLSGIKSSTIAAWLSGRNVPDTDAIESLRRFVPEATHRAWAELHRLRTRRVLRRTAA
jgi:hypothetical protein